MAQGLKAGDWVYASKARLELPADGPSAFVRVKVQSVVERSLIVELPGGTLSEPIASSSVHTNVGIQIVRVGDFDTEVSLLDPLAKSLLQFSRLLVSDDSVVLREVRSREELRSFWANDCKVYSHVVLVGHGRKDAIRFGHTQWVTAAELAEDLTVPDVEPKVIVSLCCRNGFAKFGQALSQQPLCQAVLGSFDSVHAVVASQFCQTFLAYHLLQGETLKVAFRHARHNVPGATTFRMWIKGKLISRAASAA